jgi:hypothetical protein
MVWSRGERVARGQIPASASLSLWSSPTLPPSTPNGNRPPCKHPTPTPHGRDRAQPPHAALAVAMPTVDTPAGPARHRPPPVMSPRHQTCLNLLNQFPKTESLERDRSRRPDHADVCQSGRPAHAERAAAFPCTPTSPGRALHARLPGTQRSSRYRPCPALWCTTTSPPNTESLARSLKPVH